MTHDELLNNLNFVWSIDEPQLDKAEQLRQALRAVVELAGKLQDEDPFHEDAGWNAGYNYAMYEVIQAIEEQLK